MLVFKIYDCKLRKNNKLNAKQWRFNQNTTEVYWDYKLKFPSVPNYDEALYIASNLNRYFPHIKGQKNTKVEFYFTT